jgi:hypothetical protein
VFRWTLEFICEIKILLFWFCLSLGSTDFVFFCWWKFGLFFVGNVNVIYKWDIYLRCFNCASGLLLLNKNAGALGRRVLNIILIYFKLVSFSRLGFRIPFLTSTRYSQFSNRYGLAWNHMSRILKTDPSFHPYFLFINTVPPFLPHF